MKYVNTSAMIDPPMRYYQIFADATRRTLVTMSGHRDLHKVRQTSGRIYASGEVSLLRVSATVVLIGAQGVVLTIDEDREHDRI